MELPPDDIGGVVAVVAQVAGEEDQPALGLLGGPAAALRTVGMGSVGGRDERVEQVLLDCDRGQKPSRVAQLSRVGQHAGTLARTGVIDGAG